MRKFILSVLAIVFSVSAMAYVPFIEEGKVWEYVHIFNNFYNLQTVSRKFDGKVMVNGREYSRLVTFAKYSYPDGRLGGGKTDISDEISNRISYFREEGEKVYALMRDGEIAYDIESLSEQSNLYEAVVFDFSLEEGESFPPGFFDNMTSDEAEPLYIYWQEPVRYGEDMEYRRYVLGIAPQSACAPEFVEGLGVMNNGMFPEFDLWVAPNMVDEYLLSVSSADGSLLYRSPSYYMLYYGIDTDYVPLVREDRVWEYLYHENGPIENPVIENGHDNYLLFRMRFDGIEEREGRPYRKLVYTGDIDKWSYDSDGNVVGNTSRPCDNDRVYLMREEERKVYLLNEGLGLDGMTDAETVREIPVYDFSRGAGESVATGSVFQHWDMDPEWRGLVDFRIVSTETVEIDGAGCLVQKGEMPSCGDVRVIEGIGYCDSGFLPFNVADRGNSGNHTAYALNRVYDSRGEIIYRGLDIEPGNVSVGGIMDSAKGPEYRDGTVAAAGNGLMEMRLYDMTGSIVASAAGVDRVSLETESLASGVYVAVVESGGRPVARRKIVVR